MKHIPFNMIVAHDNNYGIGINNSIPWRLSADMKHFKHITTTTTNPQLQNVVIMGRKTWDSLPSSFKPLPQRINIIISRTWPNPADNTLLASTIDDALAQANKLIKDQQAESIFCIGGSQLYSNMIKDERCKKLYITHIYNSFECDSFFPNYSNDFKIIKESEKQLTNDISYSFKELEAKKINLLKKQVFIEVKE